MKNDPNNKECTLIIYEKLNSIFSSSDISKLHANCDINCGNPYHVGNNE